MKRLLSSLLTWLLLASWPVVTSHALLEHLGIIHAACADEPKATQHGHSHHQADTHDHAHAASRSHAQDIADSEPGSMDSGDSQNDHHHHSDYHAVADGGYLRNSGEISLLPTGCRVNGSLPAFEFSSLDANSLGGTPSLRHTPTRLAAVQNDRSNIWQFATRSAPLIRAPSVG